MRTIMAAMGRWRWLLLAAAALVAQGCAVGQKVNYGYITPDLRAAGGDIALGVQDKRPYVVSKDKTPDFVGLSRGGFGNPFDVNTASGLPFADDLADDIARALGERGARVVRVTLTPQQSLDEAQADLARTGAPRALYVAIHEWKSDSFFGSGYDYDFLAIGYGPGGRKLAEHRLNGGEHLGGSGGIHSAKDELPKEMLKQGERLLNDPKLDAVLR
jgi:hypothetical protein